MRYELGKSLGLRVPEAGIDVSNFVIEQGRQEDSHTIGEHRVSAIIFVRLADRNEAGAQGALSAFGQTTWRALDR